MECFKRSIHSSPAMKHLWFVLNIFIGADVLQALLDDRTTQGFETEFGTTACDGIDDAARETLSIRVVDSESAGHLPTDVIAYQAESCRFRLSFHGSTKSSLQTVRRICEM